jgi:hypothetical protein
MAGSSNTFNAAAFRTAIRSAMTMGTPPTTADAATFCWNATITSAAAVDGQGLPFDPDAALTKTIKTPVTVPCAIEFLDASGAPTPLGSVVASKVKAILLDVDYLKVADADYIVISGNKYIRHHEPPSVGLFTVGVHTVIFVAENEK